MTTHTHLTSAQLRDLAEWVGYSDDTSLPFHVRYVGEGNWSVYQGTTYLGTFWNS